MRKNVVTSCVVVCDFCGKDQTEVAKIIDGPRVRGDNIAICDECVALCAEIIATGDTAPERLAA